MDNKKTGIFIAKIRKEKNLTQKDLADKLFVTDRAVSKWERGIGYPDIKIITELAKILEVDINEILYGEEITDNKGNENFLKDSITFYQKLQKQSILKKCLIFIPVILVLFFFSIIIFTEITKGVMPFTKGNLTMAHWPSFTKYANKNISKKFLNALIAYDYETMSNLIYPSDAKSISKYIDDFKKLEHDGIKFTKFKYMAESWSDFGFTGFYDIEILVNGKKGAINLGITKINNKISLGGVGYLLGQDINEKIFNNVISAFTVDYDNISK